MPQKKEKIIIKDEDGTFIDDKDFEVVEISDKEIEHILNNKNNTTEKKEQNNKSVLGRKKLNIEGQDDLDVYFNCKVNCLTCALAMKDPQIHKLYVETRNLTTVHKYMVETHGDKVADYDQVRNHFIKHLEIGAGIVSDKQVTFFRKNLVKKTEEISKLDKVDEIVRLKAMVSIHLERLVQTNPNRKKEYNESVKLFLSCTKTYTDLLNLELRCLGMDSTPEEMKKRIENMLTSFIGNVQQTDPEKAKELLDIIRGAMPNG